MRMGRTQVSVRKSVRRFLPFEKGEHMWVYMEALADPSDVGGRKRVFVRESRIRLM